MTEALLPAEMKFSVNAFGCKFVVYGQAAPGGSKSLIRPPNMKGKTMIVDSNQKKVMPWRQEISIVAGTLMKSREPYEGALGISVDFIQQRPKSHYGAKGLARSAPKYPAKRPDATKLLRPVEDALNGILWRDDSQVVEQHVRKLYGEPARMVFSLYVML